MTDIHAIEGAARRLAGIALETPLLQNAELDRRAGGVVLLKPECLQRTGSFKIRGAYNLLSQLSAEEKGSQRKRGQDSLLCCCGRKRTPNLPCALTLMGRNSCSAALQVIQQRNGVLSPQ